MDKDKMSLLYQIRHVYCIDNIEMRINDTYVYIQHCSLETSERDFPVQQLTRIGLAS